MRSSCKAIGILRCDKSETIIESTLPIIFRKYRKVIGIKIVIITIWISVIYFVNGSKSLSFKNKKNKVPNSGINSGWKRYEKKGRTFFNSNNLKKITFFYANAPQEYQAVRGILQWFFAQSDSLFLWEVLPIDRREVVCVCLLLREYFWGFFWFLM